MGRIVVEGHDLVLELSGLEKLEGFHSDIRVPRDSVRVVRWAADAWLELRGIRAPGTGVPGVIAVGTRRGAGSRDFAAVHGKGPAIVVELEGARFDRLVVTSDDAEAEAPKLAEQLGIS